MSWSDDTRCLHCDGRLPLYRKITHGQFCSSAHRKAYWQDQERLAVERLHQTHNSLRAYRLAEPAEAVAGQAPAVVQEALQAVLQTAPPQVGDPQFGALIPQSFNPAIEIFPGLAAADPLEYEMGTQPYRPSRTFAGVETRPLPLAKMIGLWADFSGCRWTGQLVGWEVNPITGKLLPSRPSLALLFGQTLAKGNLVGVPTHVTDSARLLWTPEPIDSATQPVTHLNMEVPPEQSDVLVQLLDEQVPHPDKLFSLAYLTPCEGGGWLLRRTDEVQPAETQHHTLVARGETLLQFTAMSLVPADAGLQGLPVGFAAAPNRIVPVELSALHPRGDAPSTKVFFAASPRDPGPRMASSQLSFRVSSGGKTVATAPAATEFTVQALAIPSRQVSATPIAGVRPSVTALAVLPYGQQPWSGVAAGPLPSTYLFPQPPATDPLIPQSRLQPMDPPAVADLPTHDSGAPMVPPPAAQKHAPLWSHAADFWQHAPRDLKLLLFAIPALIALAFHPSLPKVSLAAPKTASSAPSEFRKVFNQQWSNVRQTVLDRAAIALNEDFRSGLDDWASPGESTTSWSFDQTGFVRPGPLAIYRPSVGLTDYQMQFLGLIDKQAMSWVVRAADFDNYYVVKMEVLKPGPVPTLGIIRYAVINGKAQDRVDTPVPISARPDMLYRVLVEVHDDTFSLMVQGQMIDTWTEPRLPRGGIGFFSARGEASRVRWVQVTHQYDMLGRLCAYLAPYNIPSTTGSWQP